MTDAERDRAIDFFRHVEECAAEGDSVKHSDVEYMLNAFLKLNCYRNALLDRVAVLENLLYQASPYLHRAGLAGDSESVRIRAEIRAALGGGPKPDP